MQSFTPTVERFEQSSCNCCAVWEDKQKDLGNGLCEVTILALFSDATRVNPFPEESRTIEEVATAGKLARKPSSFQIQGPLSLHFLWMRTPRLRHGSPTVKDPESTSQRLHQHLMTLWIECSRCLSILEPNRQMRRKLTQISDIRSHFHASYSAHEL
jgi:hypothetical protein